MKKSLLAFSIMIAFATFMSAQTAPTFNTVQQKQITQILGKDYIPVFSPKGELCIATKISLSSVKALPGGGFSKPNEPSAMGNILIHKGWILIWSSAVMTSMQSTLGVERFKQLEAIVRR